MSVVANINKWLNFFNLIRCISVLSLWANAMSDDTVQSIQSFLYDRGLVQHSNAWVSVENPALLSQQDDMRMHLEVHRTQNQLLNLSFASPVSSQLGMGVAWFSRTQNDIVNSNNATLNQTWKDQYFFINLGSKRLANWGVQLEVMNSQRVAYPMSVDILKPKTSQVIGISSRIGFHHQLSKKLQLGLLTPPLLHLFYHVYPEGDKDPKLLLQWLKEDGTRVSIPQIAVGWQWSDRFQTVISNRSKSGEDDWQISQAYLHPVFSLYTAACLRNENLEFAGGLGMHLRGIDLIASYDVASEAFRLGVGFAPEQNRQLIEIVNIQVASDFIYPYHRFKIANSFLCNIMVKNLINQEVKLTVQASGNQLPSLTLRYYLKPMEVKRIQIPVSSSLYEMDPGTHEYELSFVAFQRGRQTIKDQIMFTICDRHHWSGLAEDLIYFVQADEDPVLSLGRRFALDQKPSGDLLWQLPVIQRCYQFIAESIRYIPDPKSVRERGDSVQYPDETLNNKSGDCEDIAILMISLLKSVGIDAAFAEYIQPDSRQGHVFILIDSGMSAEHVVNQSGNLQRYIVRYDHSGRRRLFIPLELTESQLSFIQSWSFGNEMYQQLAIEQGGLVEGWFHIIDVP